MGQLEALIYNINDVNKMFVDNVKQQFKTKTTMSKNVNMKSR